MRSSSGSQVLSFFFNIHVNLVISAHALHIFHLHEACFADVMVLKIVKPSQ